MTLLRMAAGYRQSAEMIRLRIISLKDEALTIFRRRKIGFVFQNYNLVPVLSGPGWSSASGS